MSKFFKTNFLDFLTQHFGFLNTKFFMKFCLLCYKNHIKNALKIFRVKEISCQKTVLKILSHH